MKGEITTYKKEFLHTLLEKMMIVRKFEEKIHHFFSNGLMHGTTHLGIGEEACAVGSTAALKKQDYVWATHRGHGIVIGKGANVNQLMAEMFGKSTGISNGVGGSMHLSDVENGILGTNGIVGANLPLACGAGLSIKMKKESDKVSVVFLGDGASNEGAFHESLNIASLWNLPVIFIIVNNGYGVSMKLSEVTKNPDLVKRADLYKIKGYEVDGNDVLQVYETVKKAREDVVNGNGPVLIVENTYRISGHSKSDGNFYRINEEIEEWKKKCPIKKLSKDLVDNLIFAKEEILNIEDKTSKIIEEAVLFAENSPEPEILDVENNVYA